MHQHHAPTSTYSDDVAVKCEDVEEEMKWYKAQFSTIKGDFDEKTGIKNVGEKAI